LIARFKQISTRGRGPKYAAFKPQKPLEVAAAIDLVLDLVIRQAEELLQNNHSCHQFGGIRRAGA
jgi:hypothetical protein